MKTVLTTSPADAAEFIKNGRIVAFPTETVYGLGANVFDEKAIRKIFVAKRRPGDNPLIAHVANLNQINSLVQDINETAQKLIDAFFPGPLTLVLPKSKEVPVIATAGLQTVGVRMPRNDLAQQLLGICGVPLVAPSANLSGKPSPTRWEAVFEDLDGRIDCILQGETTEIGLESTVVDCSNEVPVLLRTGAVTLNRLKEIVPETIVDSDNKTETPRSPGLKHRHYSPKAKVSIVISPPEVLSRDSAFIGLNQPQVDFKHKKICTSVEVYARTVFGFFRECDQLGIAEIYCERIEKTGIGTALMDRIERASAKK